MTRYWARSDLMTKNRKAKSSNSTRGKLIVVDESGTKGLSEMYVMTATVVNDRIGFRNIAEVLNPNGEIGSYKGKNVSPIILRLSKNMVDEIYGVCIPFDQVKDLNATDEAMLKELNQMLIKDDTTRNGALIFVDSKSSYKKKIDAPAILTDGMTESSNTSCIVVNSNQFGEVQTNDFIIGAIGHAINDHEGDLDFSIHDRLNGKSDSKLVLSLGKNCKEIELSNHPGNENMTAFVLNNSRHRGRMRSRLLTPNSYTSGRMRSRLLTPSVDTPLSKTDKKIMHRKTRKDNK